MKKLVLLMALSGCFMVSSNQEGLEITRGKTEKAQMQVVAAAESFKKLLVELNKETPNVQIPIKETFTALQSANEHLNESGKVTVVMQEDMGTPERDVSNLTPVQLDVWRIKYRAKSKMFKALKGIISKKLPIPLSPIKQPEPWSVTDITAVIAAIAAAAGLSGKKINNWRKRATEGRYLADELKKKCNGDFADIIVGAPTIVRDHRQLKAKETI